MKKLLLACLMFVGMQSFAQESTIIVDPIGIDIASIFSKTRAGTLFTAQGMTLATVYAPLVSVHDSQNVEYINLNVGGAMNLEDAKASPLLALGFRLDSVIKRMGNYNTWIKEHVSTANLPPIEFGPAISWYSPSHEWIYGINAAFKFGS